MISVDHTIVNESGAVDINENVIGFSIEPVPNSGDAFSYGVYGAANPALRMEPGDAGRDYGFLIGGYGPELMKKGQINIAFEGSGSNPGVLIIWTYYVPDNC